MKMPEPIMTPTTSMVESNSPRPRENSTSPNTGCFGRVAELDKQAVQKSLSCKLDLTSGYYIHNIKVLCELRFRLRFFLIGSTLSLCQSLAFFSRDPLKSK